LLSLISPGGKHEYNGHGLKADLLSPRPLLPVFFGVDMPRIRQVVVDPGGYHTIALTDNSEVYTWGHNRCGQLGYYTDSSGGGSSSSRLAESEVSPNGPLPRNYEGAYFAPTPRRVFLQNNSIAGRCVPVQQVSAGWGHSSARLQDGSLFMCGRNEFGQLGTGERSQCRVNERGHKFEDHFRLVKGPFEVDGVKSIVCGAEHSLLVCGNNEVYGTGKYLS
jgi:alpha-tubulin suppressor-like RCC1 family protein